MSDTTRADAAITEIEEQRNVLGTRAAAFAAELAVVRKEVEGLKKQVSDLEAKANGKREPSREKV